MKTIAEQIASFEAKRAASRARMDEIMAKSADEGRTLNEAETQEYDTLDAEVKTVDAHLTRLKAHEASMVERAVEIVPAKVDGPAAAAQVRAPSGIISVKSNVEPGIKMARYAMALLRAKGNLNDALSIAQNNKSWMDTTPEVATVLKAADPPTDWDGPREPGRCANAGPAGRRSRNTRPVSFLAQVRQPGHRDRSVGSG